MSDLSEAMEAALLELRAEAESLMIDTCSVQRPTGATATDPNTGVVTDVLEPVYTGPAKRQSFEAYEQTPNVGGLSVTVQRYSVHFPVGSFEPQKGDVVTWTACPLDPERVGTVDRVVGGFEKTYQTAVRVFVEVSS